MSVTLHKFVGEYGNSVRGHRAKVAIVGANLVQTANGQEPEYIVSYQPSRDFVIDHLVDPCALHLMRNWLVAEIDGPTAWDHTPLVVLCGIERFYGHDGLSEFMLDYQAAREFANA